MNRGEAAAEHSSPQTSGLLAAVPPTPPSRTRCRSPEDCAAVDSASLFWPTRRQGAQVVASLQGELHFDVPHPHFPACEGASIGEMLPFMPLPLKLTMHRAAGVDGLRLPPSPTRQRVQQGNSARRTLVCVSPIKMSTGIHTGGVGLAAQPPRSSSSVPVLQHPNPSPASPPARLDLRVHRMGASAAQQLEASADSPAALSGPSVPHHSALPSLQRQPPLERMQPAPQTDTTPGRISSRHYQASGGTARTAPQGQGTSEGHPAASLSQPSDKSPTKISRSKLSRKQPTAAPLISSSDHGTPRQLDASRVTVQAASPTRAPPEEPSPAQQLAAPQQPLAAAVSESQLCSEPTPAADSKKSRKWRQAKMKRRADADAHADGSWQKVSRRKALSETGVLRQQLGEDCDIAPAGSPPRVTHHAAISVRAGQHSAERVSSAADGTSEAVQQLSMPAARQDYVMPIIDGSDGNDNADTSPVSVLQPSPAAALPPLTASQAAAGAAACQEAQNLEDRPHCSNGSLRHLSDRPRSSADAAAAPASIPDGIKETYTTTATVPTLDCFQASGPKLLAASQALRNDTTSVPFADPAPASDLRPHATKNPCRQQGNCSGRGHPSSNHLTGKQQFINSKVHPGNACCQPCDSRARMP